MWDNFIRTFFSGSLEEPLERQVRDHEVCPDVIEKQMKVDMNPI